MYRFKVLRAEKMELNKNKLRVPLALTVICKYSLGTGIKALLQVSNAKAIAFESGVGA